MIAQILAADIATSIQLSPLVITLLIGTVTPLLTGLIVKLQASSGVKSVVALVLVAVGAGINYVVSNNGTFDLASLLVLVFATFVAHVSTYYGVWKPIGNKDGSPTMNLTPDFGIGPKSEGV
jgi:hypothetical protein